MHDLADYDYDLPADLIAAHPPAERDAGRLLVLRSETGDIEHRTVRDLPGLLRRGDRLVLNDTRVLPARLFGRRAATGGKWEGLFLGVTPDGRWRMMSRTRGKLRPGESIELIPASDATISGVAVSDAATAERIALTLREREADGVWQAEPNVAVDPLAILDRFGTMPLPPYIERAAEFADRERYQTTFAHEPGAVAAPTAGLHFTPELLTACAVHGVDRTTITLHVGIGTFKPITVERLDEHVMHSEWRRLSEAAADEINDTRRRGGRIVAVGTTSVRTLESAADAEGVVRAVSGPTELFIRPPYRFRAVDGLLTNFHLPRSSLLVLVSAFAGRERILRAYAEAISRHYRFYSYGDAMLLL
ncbi:MAG: tRNA preQ1(34) S-adenosylmethionine ribosyltransferase-isomerase QueA [Planctomycetaceae bacterium]